MARKWTGGRVVARETDGPPTVDEWHSIPVLGRPAQFAGVEEPIAYRTTVDWLHDWSGVRAFLTLRTTRGRAHLWINGTDYGEHDSHLAPACLEFEPERTNELIVVHDAISSLPLASGATSQPATLAAHARTPGIDIDLERRPLTTITSLEAVPRVTHEGAFIDVGVVIDAAESIDDSVTFSLRPEGFRGGATMERARVVADAGERTTVSKTLEVRNPSFWWPRGHGPQHRYALRAKVGADSAERAVGLRTVERTEDGLVINGQRIRAHGFSRLPGGDPHEDVRRAVDANATLLRARGHVPSEELFAACDEAGVLLWQDLPTEGPDLDVERESERASTLLRAHASHPSLALLGVQHDPIEPYEGPFGSGLLSRLAFRWRAWRCGFDRGPAAAVADSIPEWVSTFPVSGPPGTDPDAAQLSVGWRYLEAEDVEWLLDRYPSLERTVGGFGTASLTTDDADPEETPGVDPTVLERRCGDAEESRRYQARVVQTIAEALRRRGSGVIVASSLRDVAAGGGTGVLTNDGDRKPAYSAISDAYEPVQAVLDETPRAGARGVGITLCNDTGERVESTIRWEAGAAADEETVVADPFERTAVGTVEIPSDAKEVNLETTIDGRTVRNEYHL